MTLNLTIINSTSGVDTRTGCNSDTWIDGNTYTSSNNSATHNIVGGAANGCDSLVTLNLTIVNSTTGTDTRTECSSFTWIDGNTYTSSNNSATHNIVGGASNGCDSLVTLDLTINSVSDITTTMSASTISANNSMATYAWLNCDSNFALILGENNQSFIPPTTGNYAVQLTENNCVDTSVCVYFNVVGLMENSFSGHNSVFPNPTSGRFSIEFEHQQTALVITIFSASGQLIQRSEYQNTKRIQMELMQPNGAYFLNIKGSESDRQKAVIKLIKE